MKRPNYTYRIVFADGKYYKSNRDYVSLDYTSVDNEIDATQMNESNLFYLLENDECIAHRTFIEITLNDWLCVGRILVDDFIGEGL